MKWRLEFCHAASPVARLLLGNGDTPPGHGVFALFGKVGRSPRIYASPQRDAIIKQLQTVAYKKLGLTLAGIVQVVQWLALLLKSKKYDVQW